MLAAIRHLPTALNQVGKLQGRLDPPILQNDFLKDAAVLQNRQIIQGLQPEEVYVSPLLRAKQTAEVLGINDYTIDERLTEFDFGVYEGQLKTQMLAEKGEEWCSKFSELSFGEDYQLFSKRILDFLVEVKDKHRLAAIVAHGVVIRYMLALSLLRDADRCNQLHVSNNQLHIIHIP